MTTESPAAVTEDDFLLPDEPDDGPPEDLGYGFTTDADGTRRPKLKPGRPRKAPTAADLAAAPPIERPPDLAPAPVTRARRARRDRPDARPDPAMPKAGIIADGVDRLYRRAGKIVRAMDADIGQALIECTWPDDGDLSVGQAWEALCKANPRIRRFIMQAIAGGAYGDLLMAHLPIGIALVMKPWIQQGLLHRVAESMAEPDADTPAGEGGLPGGMTADDVQQMQALAEQQARKMAASMGQQLTEADMVQVRAAAARFAGGEHPGQRQQPKRTTRAQRAGAR